MNFTMKILVVSVLLVAMMALALGTEAPPEAEAAPVTEAPVQENEEDADATSNADEETESEDEDGEEAESTEGEKKHEVAKRSSCRPRGGWYLYGRFYYRYFPYARTWAQAQYHCRALGGNLASVHNRYEEIRIRAWARHRPAWIGFSDAQQERYWFWIDGTRFNYKNWCPKHPDNLGRKQHCARINWTARKCWDDLNCLARQPYVCARRRR